MLRKHIFVARRRKRFLTAVWPALMHSAFAVGFYFIFKDLPQRALLLALLIPLYLCFAISGVLICAIVEVVSEKESKMKVVQEIYGLTTFMYWASWVMYFVIVSLICIVCIFSLLTFAAPVIAEANKFLWICILLAAYMQQFECAAIVAVFFDRVQTASAMASFLNLILTLAPAAMQGWLRGQSKIIWYLAGLLPTVNVYNAISATVWLEALCPSGGECSSKGLSFHNMWDSQLCMVSKVPCPEGQEVQIFSAGESILLMLVDVVLYAFLAWWLDNVWQGEFGSAKPLTFCLDPSFMCPRRQQLDGSASAAPLLDVSGRPLALSIRRLRKVFRGKVAVDDVSLDVLGGEIFALLGHNGAGKTTAINCVVGLMPPTAGSALVNGFDVRTDVEGVRRQLSVCPQDNPLYDVFTVRQHIVFFATLRGVNEATLTHSTMEVLTALGIPDKIDELCTTLSGGQKRRLWVASALVGQTPLVFLDEPTSGMDPSSRRELWDLLLRMRATGRAILFTTHYLEEADVLADRKAVLAKGRVQAVGTSRDLKLQFGLGYHLHVELRVQAGEAHCMALRALVFEHVASAHEQGEAEEEAPQADARRHMKFTLPFQEIARFGPLLLALDARREALLIEDYSVAMTSLEEVFMALGQHAESEAGAEQAAAPLDVPRAVPASGDRVEPLARRGAKALARVRLLQIFKDKRSLYSTLIMPMLFVVLAVAFKQSDSNLNLVIYPPIAFGISVIAITMQLIKDKQAKCKYVAISQGLPVSSYWAGSFIAHYLACLPVSLLLGAAITYQPPLGLTPDGLPLLYAMMLIYPVGILLYAYNFSLLFSTVEVAAKVLPLCNMLLGTIPSVLVDVLVNIHAVSPAMDMWAKGIHIAMSLLNPLYGVSGMMIYLINSEEASPVEHFTSLAALPLYGLLLDVAVFGGNLLWQDARSRTARPGNYKAFSDEGKDSDVLAEEGRVLQSLGPGPEEAVRYLRLSHTYRTRVQRQWRETHAVRGISLGVRSGECFGLLGPNGAGKTTTLAVLTGEVRPPTAGRLMVCGHDIANPSGLAAAYRVLGVCPQVDPLWETITGRDHLLFYGRVKGVSEAALPGVVGALLTELGFEAADMDKAAGLYSGGMKRKLSLGIALIGYCSLLFLDEPSAAVDAAAKRHLWKVIKMRRREQTVVLTTHSMEEAEALCDRIAIQVKGQLRCLGSPLHIKHKYGSGYQLELFCKECGVESDIKQFVQSRLTTEAKLLESHAGRYLFQLPPMGAGSTLTLGRVFVEVQENMEAAGISDYSLTQPSLEQVFIRFAREQDAEEGEVEAPSSDGAASAQQEAVASDRQVPLLAA